MTENKDHEGSAGGGADAAPRVGVFESDMRAEDGPVHTWFELTYANYLVLHRTVLQSMPGEWQERFVACLMELQDACAGLEMPSKFAVNVRRDDGRFTSDPVPHYNRGRTRLLAVVARCAELDAAANSRASAGASTSNPYQPSDL